MKLCCEANLQTFYKLSLLRLFSVKQGGCKERTPSPFIPNKSERYIPVGDLKSFARVTLGVTITAAAALLQIFALVERKN